MISVFPNNFDLPNGKYTFNNENYTAQKRKNNQHPRDYYVIEKKDNKYTQIEPKPTKTNTIRLIDFSPMERKRRRKEKKQRKQEAYIYVKSNRFGLLYYLLPFEETSSSPSTTSSATSSSPSTTSSSTSSSPSSTSYSLSSSASSTPNSISNNENNLSDFFESDSE